VAALKGAVTEPAWRSKPSWYVVRHDGMIPPPAQRMMASRASSHVTEAPRSHAIFVSSPEVVASVIRNAAEWETTMSTSFDQHLFQIGYRRLKVRVGSVKLIELSELTDIAGNTGQM
jgi:hypothetical protein